MPIAADMCLEILQLPIGDHRQVGTGVAAVDQRAPLAIDHGNAFPRRGEEIGGGQPRDPGADDKDIDVFIAVELRETREGGGIDPIRLCGEMSLHGLT